MRKKIKGKKISKKEISEKTISKKKVSKKSIPEKDNPPNTIPEKKVPDYPTPEQLEARRDKISSGLPKFDFNKEKVIIDLTKDKEACRAYTAFSCHRPDIYLDYGCWECSLRANCKCPSKVELQEKKRKK
jgi:hypothetical protein